MRRLIFAIFIIAAAFIGFFFIFEPRPAENINWGAVFSQKHSEALGLDWKENYLALLDDLGIKRIKTIAYWDLIEPKEGDYNFADLDWQTQKAKEKGAKILLVIGMKTPRWPECHLPDWAKNKNKQEQQDRILKIISEIVLRYKNERTIWAWQVENEPFFPFGECPWQDEDFLKKEIALVKLLDPQNRPVVISDTGEFSLWLKPAKLADIVGTTMYRVVWSRKVHFYVWYPFPPSYYWLRSQIAKKIFNKDVIVVELQAEPWGPNLLYDSPPKEQQKTMNPKQFLKNIDYAKKTGFEEFYLWGSEWWYWMKEKQDQPEIWNGAKNLFQQ